PIAPVSTPRAWSACPAAHIDALTLHDALPICTDEKLVIGKNGPSIATKLSASTGSIGDTVSDSATLSGATADAGGMVTYTAYTDNACSLGARDAGTVTVRNARVPTPVTPHSHIPS